MRINYSQYPYIDNYKNVRYITETFTKHLILCEDKIKKFAFNFDSCEVCYLYKGMFLVCNFISKEGWVETGHIKCYLKDKKGYDFIFNNNTWDKELSEEQIALIVLGASFTFFIECAEVEIVYLTKKAGKYIQNIHYANDTNKNIKIYDSTWLKTIILSEGFKVRGHFRLQPIGENRNKRKLIWINEFDKSGYKKEAGILKKDN